MLVRCTVRASGACGDELDYSAIEGTRCAFYSPTPVTLAHVERLFPFDGVWHFRVKVSSKSVGLGGGGGGKDEVGSYLWRDLTRAELDKAISPISSDAEEIEILALALSLPEVDEAESIADTRQYLDAVSEEMHNVRGDSRAKRRPAEFSPAKTHGSKTLASVGDKLKTGVTDVFKKISSAAGGTGVNMESVTSGAASLWSSITSQAKQTMGYFSQGTVLSDTAESNLAELSELVGTTLVVPQNKEHVALLRDVWDSLFNPEAAAGGAPVVFSITGDKWKEAGFQKADPSADLKNSGILALRAVLHMSLSYKDRTQEMLEANKANAKTKYPFAIVAINITLLLVELLHLRDNGYMGLQGVGYWAVFEDPSAFYEIFCLCFFHMNATWVQRQAVRTDFGKLIGEIKQLVTSTLARNPTNLMDFRMLGIDEGMIS